MARRSRLKRRIERQTQKTLATSIVGIIVVLFLVLKFGIPLLINFSLFLAGTKNSKDTSTQTNNNDSFIAPPVLNQTYTATNSAQLQITGTASKGEEIELFLNDNLISNTNTKDDGSFLFDNIKLSEGSNSIKAKVKTQDNKESSFSNELDVMYGSKPPKLSVDSPSDNQSFSKDNNTAAVSGTTDPGVKVTVNGFWAIVDETGKFSYNLPLQSGDNQIKVIATDEAGNTTEVDKKVTYSP